MLHRRGVPLEAKPFAVGVRIEHRQSAVDAAQYKRYAGHPGLPAAYLQALLPPAQRPLRLLLLRLSRRRGGGRRIGGPGRGHQRHE